jgi:hypothetical protein
MKLLRFLLFFSILMIITIIVAKNSEATNIGEQVSYTLKDTTIKAVWREDVYDSKMKANVNVIRLNEQYFTNISEPEKAVLGYLASTIGNECYTDGKSDVKCKLLSALSLGSQCSETNKQFLSSWFKNEPEILKQVENCKPMLPGSNVEKTFDVVKITTSADMIKVSVKGLKLNIKENTAASWSENISFRVNGDNLTVVERTKKD